MIAEVEEKVDKGVVFADAARARKEVLKQEIDSAILSTMTLPPQPPAAPGIGWNVCLNFTTTRKTIRISI